MHIKRRDFKMKIVTIFLMTIFLKLDASVRICTNPSNFSFLRRNKQMTGLSFDAIENTGLVKCAVECQIRKKCNSFSFEYVSGKCVLFQSTIEQSYITEKGGTDLSNIKHWPARLAGICGDNRCSDDKICRLRGSSSKTCVIAYCPDPPKVENATPNFTTTFMKTKVGSRLSYTCDKNFKPEGERMCLKNGSWSDFRCVFDCGPPPSIFNAKPNFTDDENLNTTLGSSLSYICNDDRAMIGHVTCQPTGWTRLACLEDITSCSDLLKCNSSYTDGEYWLTAPAVGGKGVKIYCDGMKSLNPSEYVSLQRESYADNRGDGTTDCGKAYSGSDFICCGRQTWKKLKLEDLKGLDVVRKVQHPFTESNSCGSLTFFATACDCGKKEEKCTGIADYSVFHLNLSGTGFIIDPNQQFSLVGGISASMRVERQDVNRILTVKMIGSAYRCSSLGPKSNKFALQKDPRYDPPIDSATVPECQRT